MKQDRKTRKANRKKKNFWQRNFPCKGDRPADVILKLLILAAICVVIVCAWVIADKMFIQGYRYEKDMDSLRDIYSGTLKPAQSETSEEEPAESTVEEPKEPDEDRAAKFARLREINPDIKGWLYIPNTKVDYPVLQSDSSDPVYYLYRDYHGNYNSHGSLFIDGHSAQGTQSKNIVIHGHHMNDGSMFKGIMSYDNLDFYKQNPVITLDTPEGLGYWKVFAVLKISTLPEHGESFGYIRSDFSDDNDFLNFVYQIELRSMLKTPVDINEDDQLMMLSTCSYELKDYRTVVVARKVREGEDVSVDVSKAHQAGQPLQSDGWYRRYGGSAPEVTDFQTALENGQIDWYTPPVQQEGAEESEATGE